jgi:hypothetical protein
MNTLAQDNRVDSGHLFLLFFLIFFSIVSFNIELIENWVLLLFFDMIFMRLSYSHNLSHKFCGLAKFN